LEKGCTAVGIGCLPASALVEVGTAPPAGPVRMAAMLKAC
jgi:hypothetical protein